MNYRMSLIIAFMAIMIVVGAGVSSAAIFSSISYDNTVYTSNPQDPSPFRGAQQNLIGKTLPVSQTISVNDGPTAQATYNFSDSGNFASLQISTSESLDGPDEQAGEESPSDSFYLAQPVTYHLFFQDTVSAGLVSYGGAGLYPVAGSGSIENGSYESDGALEPGILYSLNEGFQLNNNNPGQATNATGTTYVLLTLTAIPEPSSVCLLALTGIGVLARRRPCR